MMLRCSQAGCILTLLFCCIFSAQATNLSNIKVYNSSNQAQIRLSFTAQPIYAFFPLHNPERVVLDIRQITLVQGLPLIFSGKNIVKKVRSSKARYSQSIRLVFELTQRGKTRAFAQREGSNYNVIFTILGTQLTQTTRTSTPFSNVLRAQIRSEPTKNFFNTTNSVNPRNSGNRIVRSSSGNTVIVAIDAGHGGQDPGAIGAGGLKEKNVTIAIARKLKMLLKADPMFKAVMTREGDYFISVMGRSDVARKQHANLLVSIHADAAPNHSASGASVWVLSNRRANSEMASWLEQHEKQSELLGGAGDLLANNHSDPYLSQAVLDLQFGHSQRVGYDVAAKVITQLQRLGKLHKRRPEHASLGVLRSPDIPSLLVETGFISNPSEERLLGSSAYQQKITDSIYKGLRSYFMAHLPQSVPNKDKRPLQSATTVELETNPTLVGKAYRGKTQLHIVKRGETLLKIAAGYDVSMSMLQSMNALKKDTVWVGQSLTVPDQEKHSVVSVAKSKKLQWHKVVRGDSLTAIAAKYDVSPQVIQQANRLKSQNVMLGQTLKIPAF